MFYFHVVYCINICAKFVRFISQKRCCMSMQHMLR
jgi:hypothetical protein